MMSPGLRAAVCGSLMVGGVLLAGADARAMENVTLITDFGFNGRHAYFYVALEKGYYKAADLEVTLGTAANVRLLDSVNLNVYRQGGQYSFYGGYVTRSPYSVRVPTAAADQDKPPHPVAGDQMAGKQAAEDSGPAGDQHSSVRAERTGDGEDDLADMLGAAHDPERVRRAADIRRGHRKLSEDAALKQGQYLGQHLADPLRRHVQEVVRLVGHALVLGCHRRRVTQVCLAYLDEPPAAGQEAQ